MNLLTSKWGTHSLVKINNSVLGIYSFTILKIFLFFRSTYGNDYYGGNVNKRQINNNKNADSLSSPTTVENVKNVDKNSDDYYDDYYGSSYPTSDKRSDDVDSDDGGYFDQAQIVIAEKLPK